VIERDVVELRDERMGWKIELEVTGLQGGREGRSGTKRREGGTGGRVERVKYHTLHFPQ
jgi:hypothetical protein